MKQNIKYLQGVENNYLASIIEPLKDQKILGIETNDWLYKKEDLEHLFKYGEPLIRSLKNLCT